MSEIRYGKPSMNDLPYELGKSIFDEILNSKPVDREAIDKECAEIKKEIFAARERMSHGKQE